MTKTFDDKCYDLADAFLEDEPNINSIHNTTLLAQQIQQTIEDFIKDKKDNNEPPDAP